jgi:hypothetical protein
MKRGKELLRSPGCVRVGVRDLEGLDLFYQGVEWHSPSGWRRVWRDRRVQGRWRSNGWNRARAYMRLKR